MFRVGEEVKAACDIYQHADDYSPGGVLARKGERLMIEGTSQIPSFDYIVSDFRGNGNFNVTEKEIR